MDLQSAKLSSLQKKSTCSSPQRAGLSRLSFYSACDLQPKHAKESEKEQGPPFTHNFHIHERYFPTVYCVCTADEFSTWTVPSLSEPGFASTEKQPLNTNLPVTFAVLFDICRKGITGFCKLRDATYCIQVVAFEETHDDEVPFIILFDCV